MTNVLIIFGWMMFFFVGGWMTGVKEYKKDLEKRALKDMKADYARLKRKEERGRL